MKIILIVLMILWPMAVMGADSVSGYPRVVDGDTLAFGKVRVRLEGIDAPEAAQRCLRSDGTPYPCGKMATAALLMQIGTDDIVCDIAEKDRYGRGIAVCRTMYGLDLNKWMVRTGWAAAYRAYSGRYIADEGWAQKRKLGIWRGEFAMPWDWRREKRLRKK